MDGNDWGSAPETRGDDVPGVGPEHRNGTSDMGDVLAAQPMAEGAPVEEASETTVASAAGHPDTVTATASDEMAVATPATSPAATDEEPDSGAFQVELAKMMHAAARTEHDRILGEVERRGAAHMEGVRSSGTADHDQLRTKADEVVAGIEAWAEAEVERIRLERQRRIDAHRQELEARLEWQASLVDREVAGVEAGVREYREQIDAFFARLDAESDPATIAALATRVPAMPRLDDVGAAARARAVAELPRPVADRAADDAAAPAVEEISHPEEERGSPTSATGEHEAPSDGEASISQSRLIAVMDPLAAARQVDDGGWPSPSSAEVPAVADDAPTLAEALTTPQPEGSVAAVTAATTAEGEAAPDSGRLLNTIPTSRPFSWLVRGDSRNGRSGSGHEG